jgi:hypothetical protein
VVYEFRGGALRAVRVSFDNPLAAVGKRSRPLPPVAVAHRATVAGKEIAMIGSPVPQQRLEDYRPTREHWVLLGVAFLFVNVYWFSDIRKLIGDPSAQRMYGSVLTFLCVWGFSQAKGGLSKVVKDWYNANWWGYNLVTWMTSSNSMDSHVINYKNYAKTVMVRWNLYVPLGGLFAKPFLTHNGKRSPNFKVTKVTRDFLGGIESITVGDNEGNRLKAHPSWFLNRLEKLVPAEGKEGRWTNGIMVLISNGEQQAENKLAELTRDRDNLKCHWGSLVHAVDYMKKNIRVVIEGVELKDRLKTTREWKWARTELETLCQEPKGPLYDAMHGAGTSAGPQPDHTE